MNKKESLKNNNKEKKEEYLSNKEIVELINSKIEDNENKENKQALIFLKKEIENIVIRTENPVSAFDFFKNQFSN